MFHTPMGRFQLELIYYFTYFSTVVPSNIGCFYPVGLSFLIRFQKVLWVLTEENSTPTRPVENVVLITEGLRERNNKCLMGRRWTNR